MTKTARCRSCKAPIQWVKTTKGKAMPVDLDDASRGRKLFNPKTMVSHFATCPHAEEHRRAT